MHLELALSNVWAAGADGCEARRVVGAHLAVEAGLRSESTVLGVGGWGLELIEGAKTVARDLRRYSVWTHIQPGRQPGHGVAWVTAMPPADRPLTIFIATAITGLDRDVVAVLDDLRRDGLPPVTLCAARVGMAGRDLIRARYPDVALVTPNLDREPATTPTGEIPT